MSLLVLFSDAIENVYLYNLFDVGFFTLRCLSQKITPNSLKLKSNIKTTRGKWTVERAERQLENERVRNINITTETCSWQRDTCIDNLKGQISPFYFQECVKFIERVKELRHQSVLERQLSTFEWLWQRFRGGCSNKNGLSKIQHRKQGETTSPTNNTTVVLETTTTEATNTTTPTTATSTDMATINDYINRWVRNLSSTPLTELQVSLLVYGPNFAVAPRHPPMGVHHCDRASLPEARASQCRGT